MDKEKENEQPIKSDISVESASGKDVYQPNEFVEPLKEVTDSSFEDFEPQADISTETGEIENANPDEDKLSDDRAEEADQEESKNKCCTRNESKDANATAIVGAEKRSNLSKLAFSVVIIAAAISILLTYGNKWSFRAKQEAPPPVVQTQETIPIESPGKIDKPVKHDPYKGYRALLNEVTQLRESLLLKQQDVKRLKEHYGKGIEKLENEILYEMLSKKVQNYQQALQNKRIELGLRTIQRRKAYIQKLDEPINWLEQGSEELLYLRRKAIFDLQIIDIAGGIDMDMHMRHINAAVQKYLLTADNLAIDPKGTQVQPLEHIWRRLFARTQNDPHLRAELNNWYIQQEVCNGNLSRIGELSDISIDTAKCVSENDGSDLFLNNITVLSPRVAKYLCQWNGKWMCLNGVQTLSPATAQHLFQWEGEWISLNGLSEFPPDLAKHLVQWKGKQLELMGLNCDKNKTDPLTLTYMAEWEKAGGKLFVPDPVRVMMKKR